MSTLNKAGISLLVAVLLMAGMLVTMGQINNGGGGGGSGTVGNCTGAGNAYYSGAGTTTSCDTSLTDNGAGALTSAQGTITTSAPYINHSATWNAGAVAFTDSTSNITCTAAATGSIAYGFGTAGTQWQFKYGAANCATPQMLSPAGAVGNPAYSFSGDTSSGMYSNGAGALRIAVSGADNLLLTTGNTQVSNTSGLLDLIGTTTSFIRFGSGHNGSLSMSAAGGSLFSLGNGTQNDETALLRAGNACRVTADITLPVNTATTVCSWSLPAVAKAWAWQCQIPWVISAGSGTNTLAIIANPSQTPTAATNGSAEIKTTNTNTATEATTAISASGGTTLLTSGTITPNAATFMSSTSGTLLASGTAGTFTIQMTAAGTTATAAAKAGATCQLY